MIAHLYTSAPFFCVLDNQRLPLKLTCNIKHLCSIVFDSFAMYVNILLKFSDTSVSSIFIPTKAYLATAH